MTQTQKRPLFKARRPSLFFLLIGTLACFGASFFISISFFPSLWKLFLSALALALALLSLSARKYRSEVISSGLKKEQVLEAFNIAGEEMSRLRSLKNGLEKKISNYKRLEEFTERLNNEVSLELVCGIVTDELFRLRESRGNVLLYLVNPVSHRLELKALKKEDPSARIQEKAGDIFDHWALRHNKPLLVESASSDFRFDPERVKKDIKRPLESIMCVPMETESRMLGVLRVDSPASGAYSSEDLRFFSVIADIAKLSIENAFYFSMMQELSITDGLTGVFLRRHAIERIKEECLRSQRDCSPLSFFMIDIDHFKEINDAFGHTAGDVVLKKVAQWLKNDFGLPGQLVFRYGGEEFGIILPGAQKEEAALLAENFRKSLHEREVNLRRQKLSVRVSGGVASFPKDASGPQGLMQAADEALMKAKKEGRDRVCIF